MQPIDIENLRQEVESDKSEFSLWSFSTGPAVHFENDGRVVEKVEGVDIYSNELDESSDEYTAWFHHQMISRYRMRIEVLAITAIQAGLRRIRKRHRTAFVNIVAR